MVYKIAYMVGSADPNSLNRRLANAMILGSPRELEFVEIPLIELPFYQPAYDDDPTVEGIRARSIAAQADGILIVTPEYNRSIPAVLKNGLDWLSRPRAGAALAGKPVMIAGASPGPSGTATAQSQLRSILPTLGVNIMGTPELYIQIGSEDFAQDGSATTQGTQKFLSQAMQKFAGFVERI